MSQTRRTGTRNGRALRGGSAALALAVWGCTDRANPGVWIGPADERRPIEVPPAPGTAPFPGDPAAERPASPLPGADLQLAPDAPRYYVDAAGDDAAPGSAQAPFASVQHALEVITSGEIVVRAGTYREHLVIPPASRGPDRVLALTAERGAILTSAGAAPGRHPDLVYLAGVEYVRIAGFTLIGGEPVDDASGIRVFGSGAHLALLRNEISGLRGASAMGITVYGSDGAGISDLAIEDNFIHDCEPAPSEALVVNGNVQRFRIAHNRVSDVNNIGIDVIAGERWLSSALPGSGQLIGNQVTRANSSYDGSAAGIYVDGASDMIVEKNRVSECDFGIEIGAENPQIRAERVLVRDNLIYANYRGGIIFGGYDQRRGRVAGADFLHNSLYANSRPDEVTAQGFPGQRNGEFIAQYADDCRAENNIFRAAPGAEQGDDIVAFWGDASLTLDHNLYFPARLAGAERDRQPMFADPRFADPQSGDLRLLPGSPAIDAALPVPDASDTDVDGDARNRSAPDLGAYERQ
jgi:parallel beta-helix repeat protein